MSAVRTSYPSASMTILSHSVICGSSSIARTRLRRFVLEEGWLAIRHASQAREARQEILATSQGLCGDGQRPWLVWSPPASAATSANTTYIEPTNTNLTGCNVFRQMSWVEIGARII